MTFKLKISDTVVVTVVGKIPQGDGTLQVFHFKLTARRLKSEELRAALSNAEQTTAEFLTPLVTGWSGVLDADDAPLPFSAESLAALFDVPGLSGVAFQAYLESVGARGKEKN